ncbi:hypothetical protein JXD38_06240 [candidate division WOR-3 bacterium]|nr:hypothetical protein [candidate division WOR-3 bacterium]
MTRMLVLAVAAAVALLGTSCKTPAGPIYPMTLGSVWNMDAVTLAGATGASLDTVETSTETNTALDMVILSSGREVVRFRTDATTHYRDGDSTSVTTSYSYVAEVHDTIFYHADLDDTAGTIFMMSNPEVGQTWSAGIATATVIGQEDVTVPGGTYKGAWKVKLSTDFGIFTLDIYEWFARGTGLVRVYSDATSQGYRTQYNSELTSADIK